MEYRIEKNTLTPEEHMALWESAGWGSLDRELVENSLRGSYATFAVRDGGRIIAMARLIGDGGMAFFSEGPRSFSLLSGKGHWQGASCAY